MSGLDCRSLCIVIICFNCPSDIRKLLDALVKQGDYKDDSEAITTAIRNLAVLHAHLQGKTSLDIEPSLSTATPTAEAQEPHGDGLTILRLDGPVSQEDRRRGRPARILAARRVTSKPPSTPHAPLTVPAVFARPEASPSIKMI